MIDKDIFKRLMAEMEEEHESADSLTLNSKVLIIDGLNTFIRAFSVNPATNVDGVHVGGITGFLRSIGYAIKTIQPTRVIITFDGKGGSARRKKLFPDYKANRKVKSKLNRSDSFSNVDDERQSMEMQISRTFTYLQYLPVSLAVIENIEADDSMAYITKQLLPDSQVVIMSTDKDFLQLVNDRISVWSPTKKILYTPQTVVRDYQIPPHNFLTYRILEGDKSDNIPGIPGAGLKTIINRFPRILYPELFTVDMLLEDAEKGTLKIHENILNNKKMLELNTKLMQLDEVDISAGAKSKLRQIVNSPVPELNKFDFSTTFLKDQLQHTIKNVESWLTQVFVKLNKFAKESHG